MNVTALKRAALFMKGKAGAPWTVSETERAAFKTLYPSLRGPDTARTLWKDAYGTARRRNPAQPEKTPLTRFVGDFRSVDRPTIKQFLRGQRVRRSAAEQAGRPEYKKDLLRAGGAVLDDKPALPHPSMPKGMQEILRDQHLRYRASAQGGALAKSTHQAKYPAKHQWFEHQFAELPTVAKAVWRHYYKKLKKQTRGGKLGSDLSGYLPGDGMASKSGLLWRGTHKGEVESLALRKRFKSKWTNDNFPNRPRTYVAGSPQQTQSYAITAAGYQHDRGALNASRTIFGSGRDLTKTIGDARIYAIQKSALKRSDEQIRKHVGDYAATAPLKGGVKAKEVRALLKPAGISRPNNGSRRREARALWKPVPLGEIQKRQFSRSERGRVEFSALRKRIVVGWYRSGSGKAALMNLRGVGPIGHLQVSKAGRIEWAHINPKFRGMGLASKMYGEAMRQAPKGRLVSDSALLDGGVGVWSKLGRTKGYRIKENLRVDPGMDEGLVARNERRPVFIGRIKREARFSRIDRGRVEMSRENLAKQRRRDPIGREAGIPLTGQIAHDRYVIENRRKDVAKRDSNILRAGIAGTAAGAVLGRGRLPLKARLAAGALAGAGSVIGVRAATQKTGRDVYGARHPWAARSEAAPAVIGAGAAGYGAYRILRKKFFKMSDGRFEFNDIEVPAWAKHRSGGATVINANGMRFFKPQKSTLMQRLGLDRNYNRRKAAYDEAMGQRVANILKADPDYYDKKHKMSDARETTEFGVRKIGNIRIIRSKHRTEDGPLGVRWTKPRSAVTREKLSRLATRQPIVDALARLNAWASKQSLGRSRDAIAKRIREHNPMAVPAKGKKGYRTYISGDAPGLRGNLRNIAAHERFHHIPVVGQTEIGAHFVGGLLHKKGKLDVKRGAEMVGHLVDTRPGRFAAEGAVAAGAVAGAGQLASSRLQQRKKELSRFEFAKKEKRQMNPYVMAGLSGAVSGAALGFLPLLRRGTTLKTALKTAVGGAAAGGAVVGGGSLLGSKILGDPNNKEGAAFTKRAAVGGALVGGTLGVAGGLVARRVPLVNRHIGNLAKEWRPAHMIQKSGSLKAAAIGGVAGAGYGLAQGADEGQQVDSIRNIRKDLKRMHGLSSRHEFENVTVKQKRDWLSKARDTAQLAGGLGLLGLTGYAGLKLHGVAKIAQRQIPRVSQAIQKEAPSVARYTKATLRSIRKASSQVSQSSRDLPIKIEGVRDVIDQGMLGRGGIRAAFGKRRELSMFEEKRSIIPAAVLTGAGVAGATAGTIIGLRGGRAVVRAVKRNEKAARQQAVRIEKAIKGTVRSVGTVAGRASQTQQALQNSTRVYADVGKVYREAKGGLYNVLHPINTLRETRRAFRAGLKGRDYYRTKTRPEWAMEAGVPHVELEKPFHGYNKKRHAKTGGLNDGFRKKYNSEHGSNLKRPVTTEPSKLKPGSKAAKRRASFCARMGGMQGPTSKEGQLTPKGAALKRWNCSAKQELIEMNDRTYRPGSTAEMRSMRQTPAMKQLLKKENARGSLGQKLRTLMKVLPFEARRRTVEFQQQLAPRELTPEQRHVRNTLLVTGAVVVPAAAAGYVAHRSFREADRKYGDMLNRTGMRPSDVYAGTRRSNRVLALPAPSATRGDVPRKIKEAYSTGTSWGVRTIDNTGKPSAKLRSRLAQTGANSVRQGAGVNVLPMDYARSRYGVQNRKVIVPPPGPRATEASKLRADRNMALKPIGQKRDPKMKPIIARGQRLQAIGGDTKNWTRGERKVARATLAVLRKRYGFVSKQAVTELDIYARNKKTGRASGFWDYTRGEELVGRDKKAVDVTLPAFIGAAQREATTGWRYARRAGGLAQDVTEVASGQKTKKREWEKGWFRNAVAVGGMGAGLLAHGLIYRSGKINPRAPRWAKSYTRTVDNVGKSINQTRASVMKQVNRSVGLSALLRLKQISLDYDAAMVGWDVRDPRGRSARVFAPGARPRYRRQADWHETKEGQRKVLIGAGMLGALATGAGGILVGRRIGQVKTLVKRRGIYSGYQKSQKSKQVIIPFPTAS